MTVSSPEKLTDEALHIHDQFLSKRFHRLIEYGNLVFSTSLPEGSFTAGSDFKSNDFIVKGSPNCPDFLAKIERQGKTVRVILAEDIHNPENATHEATGHALTINVNSDISLLLSPPFEDGEIMFAVQDMNSSLIQNLKKNLPYQKAPSFPFSNEFIIAGEMTSSQFFFEFKGNKYNLTVHSYNDGLNYQIAFKDLTNESETYQGGRIIDGEVSSHLEEQKSHPVIVNFNFAVHRPCAINPHVTCPNVPMENYLGFRVEAGEKLPKKF